MISISKAEHPPSFWNRGPGELGNGEKRERERETGNKVEQRRADERDWNKFDKEEQSYQYQFPRMVAALSQEYIPLNLYRVFTFSFILVTALSENP